MNETDLISLLSRSESATLDFKRELKIYGKGEGPKRERDELCRDILALANGAPRVVGEEKYLIIGRADKPGPNGIYELFDIGDQYPTSDDLLKLLAGVAYPSLNSIYSEVFEVTGKRLLVITIPPTAYVHETTRILKTPKREYTEYTVFMRRDESIVVASASDRVTLRRSKQKFFDERENVPPTQFGATLGAFLLAPIAAQQSKKQLDYGPVGQTYMGILGALIGAFLGGSFGNGYKDYRYFLSEWPDLNAKQKTAVTSAMSIIATLFIVIWKRLFRRQASEHPKVPRGEVK